MSNEHIQNEHHFAFRYFQAIFIFVKVKIWWNNKWFSFYSTSALFAVQSAANISPNLTRPAKTVLKIDSCSGWGVHFVLGVHLHIFPVNYAWKKFFTAIGGAGAPTAPPGYAYGCGCHSHWVHCSTFVLQHTLQCYHNFVLQPVVLDTSRSIISSLYCTIFRSLPPSVMIQTAFDSSFSFGLRAPTW